MNDGAYDTFRKAVETAVAIFFQDNWQACGNFIIEPKATIDTHILDEDGFVAANLFTGEPGSFTIIGAILIKDDMYYIRWRQPGEG